MTRLMLRLAAGAALGGHGEPLDALREACLEGDQCLRQGASADGSGFGWVSLPHGDPAPLEEAGAWLSSFDAIIQIGIGGSALGNLMLHNALLHPNHNELPRDRRPGPRFYMADNVDPRDLAGIWDLVDPSRTALVAASKSGSTAETMTNFLWLLDRMTAALGEKEALARLLVLTDPEQGTFRAFVRETECRSLPIPSSVGGRYSVLSAVGLAAAAALGIPIRELLAGARAMDQTIQERQGSVRENPAWLLAGLSYLHYRQGRNMTVLMPYADGLRDFSEWFAQLWGESLGKEGQGSTPVRALGAIDQHSQIQLYTSGPDDKLYTILNVKEHALRTAVPASSFASLKALAYLEGKDLGEILQVEARATAASLAQAGRPVIWAEIPKLDAYCLGGLVYLYEFATALTGFLLDVDPFDQPGVEQGKKYIYGLLGRSGFADAAAQVEEHATAMETLRLEC